MAHFRAANKNLTVLCSNSSGAPGPAHARNAGTGATSGDFLVFVDGDDVVRPRWLSELVETAADADMCRRSVVTSGLNSPDAAEWRPVPAPTAGWSVAGWYTTAIGANIGVWRDVHAAIEGFDESLAHIAEDPITRG